MESIRHEYRGHVVELRTRRNVIGEARNGEGGAEPDPELLIDEQLLRYGQLPDGTYFLNDYAYDWQGTLAELADRFIDYQESEDRSGGRAK